MKTINHSLNPHFKTQLSGVWGLYYLILALGTDDTALLKSCLLRVAIYLPLPHLYLHTKLPGNVHSFRGVIFLLKLKAHFRANINIFLQLRKACFDRPLFSVGAEPIPRGCQVRHAQLKAKMFVSWFSGSSDAAGKL